MTQDPLVIAPNFKRRLSGVTATIVRLVPVQSKAIDIVAAGPVLPDDIPQMPLWKLPLLKRTSPHPSGYRVWHARRNVEMIAGLALKHVLRKRLKLVFTSASQRQQTGLTKGLIRQMDAVVATSDATADYLSSPSQTIMHGIDIDTFSPSDDKPALRAKLGLPTTGPLVGCYGRIRAQKGTDVYVKAMIAVLKSHPDATSLVMGRATEKHKAFAEGLMQQAMAAGLTNRIIFCPEVPPEAMADWYRVLDLYIAPQRWEGFGLTPLEAMACACPVIATRVGAFEALIVEGQTGTLIDPNDTDAMIQATNALLNDAEKRIQWAKNSRAHVEKNFSIQTEAQALVDLYHRLLNDA